MGKRLDTITNHTKNVDEFQQAVAHISSAASQRMPDPNAEATTPARKRATSGPKSAFSPGVKLKPSKALDLPPALSEALRHANISVNHENLDALVASLHEVQLEREKKLQEHYDSSSSATHGTLAERLSKADGDLRSILGTLYSHTPFQQVNLSDPKLENELKHVERELEDANDQLLSAEASELSLSDPKVRSFIAKYGK